MDYNQFMCVLRMHFRFDPHNVNNVQNFMQKVFSLCIFWNLELIFHSWLTSLVKLHVVDNMELIKLHTISAVKVK